MYGKLIISRPQILMLHEHDKAARKKSYLRRFNPNLPVANSSNVSSIFAIKPIVGIGLASFWTAEAFTLTDWAVETVFVSGLLILAELGSIVPLDNDLSTVTVTLNFPESPGFSVPIFQLILLPETVPNGDEFTKVVPAGSSSVKITLVAGLLPIFAYFKV